jgi:hypothetical protein
MDVPTDVRLNRQITAFDTESEVQGKLILSALRRLSSYSIVPLLARHDLDKVEPEVWYPFQMWLNIVSDISTNGLARCDTLSLGSAVAEALPLPAEFDKMTFTSALKEMAHIYQTVHRGGNCGHITALEGATREIRFETCTPYPDDFIYGLILGMARRFAPNSIHFTAKFDDDTLRRDQGGQRTVVSVVRV